jgi:hypothetical protein
VSGTAPLGEIAKSVTARFNLVGLVPSALFAVGIGALVASGSFSGVPSMHLLAVRLREINVLIASIAFLAVLSAALVLHPFQLLLVRILEGYWEDIPALRNLRFVGVEINRRRRMKILKEKKDAALMSRLYPELTSELLPTRLGNVLRAAERRAGRNYGFTDPIAMLPRIYPYISAPLAEAIGDARDELDIACRMCAVLWSLAVIVAGVLAGDGAVLATGGFVLAVPVAAGFFGAVSYRGAVRAGESYGRFLFYVFDLHRRDLIRALGYEPPRSPKEEFALIGAISGWLVNGQAAPTKHRERLNRDSVTPPSL